VFLMFSIGMRLSLRRLRRLGLGLPVAAFTGAIVVFNLVRAAGGALDWNPTHTLFLAGMLMVSSSAIVSKLLHETGATHERAGQMAMGIAVLEDVVAIVMLSVLGSYVQLSGRAPPEVLTTVGLLAAFVVLAGVVGLLLVPWLLRRISAVSGEELPTIMTAGLLFVLAVAAQRAGFSLALGAFLLGAIVAETPHRGQLDRTFEGLRDVFSAVFFVAIGMMIDVRTLPANLPLILGVTALALGGRIAAVTAGMLVTGATTRDALRVGLTLPPLGEFSFIIAQLGIAAGALPARFRAVAVGASLLTTLAATYLIRQAGPLSARLEARQPRWLEAGINFYRGWLVSLRARGQQSRLWQLSKRRFLQIGLQALLVTGLLVFSEQIFAVAMQHGGLAHLGRSIRWLPPVLFWGALTLVALVPLLALWRNVSAMALLYAEATTAGQPQAARLERLTETGLKAGAALLVLLWLGAILPMSGAARWLPLVSLTIVGVGLTRWRSRLIYWHSFFEIELQERLAPAGERSDATLPPWLAKHRDWQLTLAECVLPDLADCRGKTIGELGLRTRFGCTVTGIERQGVTIPTPTADTTLFPRDKVLLLGDAAQTEAGRQFLQRVAMVGPGSAFDEVRMETVTVPPESPLAGPTLAALHLARRFGVQVAGRSRSGQRMLNPGGDERLAAGDEVLVLGRADEIAAFKAALAGGEK
jgi:CPA2 family monovalent cation:H+ antiporter-2